MLFEKQNKFLFKPYLITLIKILNNRGLTIAILFNRTELQEEKKLIVTFSLQSPIPFFPFFFPVKAVRSRGHHPRHGAKTQRRPAALRRKQR